MNFTFWEWEPYISTASEQKVKNAKKCRNSTFLHFLIYTIAKQVVDDADPYCKL